MLLICTAGAVAQVAPGEDADRVRLVLPAEIYAVAGHEINIYFDNVLLTPNIHNYALDVACALGRQDADRWRFTPTEADVGEHTLSIKVLDGGNRTLAQGETTVRVSPGDAGAGASFTLLCVGDSLTQTSTYPRELWEMFSAEGEPRLKLIGTQPAHEGLAPEVVCEGYGGWTWATFCTKTQADEKRPKSPFVRVVDGKPVLDFQQYCDEINGGDGPDFITVMLGCNDVFGASDETIEAAIDRMFGYADSLLAEFHRVRADVQIGLVLPAPPAASQDAFGANYRCGQTRWQYRRNQHRVVERMIERFARREAEGLFIVPAYLNIDTVHGFRTRAEPANSRSETEVARQANGVHPGPAGHRQIADTIYYWLKWRLGG